MKDVAGNLEYDNREQNIECLSGRMTCLLNLERIHLNGSIMTEYMTAGLRDFQMKKTDCWVLFCYAGCVGVKEGLC